MNRNTLILIAGFLLFLSCSNPFAATPGNQVENIVSGIFITSENGDVINVWGNPERSIEYNSSNAVPSQFSLATPYPNPSISSFSFDFALPQASRVIIWMETAKLPENSMILPFERQIERPFQRIILVNRQLPAGTFSYSTFGTIINSKCVGGELEPGFYRLFIAAGTFGSYSDIYIAGKKGFAPPGLEKFIRYSCDA